MAQAFASLAVFAHPETVRLTGARNIFITVRGPHSERGEFKQVPPGLRVMSDDNKSPTDAFIWPHGLERSKYRDLQFNHVWRTSKDPADYTSLANLCVTPAFLAKLTDSDLGIQELARYHAYDVFDGYHPDREPEPPKPPMYESLQWAPPLPPVSDLEEAYRAAMKSKPKDRTVRSARELGWYFSGYRPDSAL